MCAIAGLWDTRLPLADALEAQARTMGRALAHRGPDDEGYWTDPAKGLALAQRRLSIIDLSPAGHQPMISRNGRYVIVFNGEVYNFEELRRDLPQQGGGLRGHSDTEVILECFAEFGIEPVVKRMAGMFAIALWDRQTGALTLMRDRVGKKPLYYGMAGSRFVFTSELKAVCALPDAPLSLDRDALGRYLQFGYIPAPASIYKEMRKLPGGHLLTITSPQNLPAPVPYWTVAGAEEAARGKRGPISDDEAMQEFAGLLRTCVGQRMISDAPLGAFLSGGIDSSLVVSLMQAQSTSPVRTFSIAFEEPEFNEGPHAKMVAQHLGTRHTEMLVTARDALEFVPRLPEIYDEPFADASQIPTCLLCQLTRRHVTVALSGDGGDELFLGYAHYGQAARRIDRMMSLPGGARQMAAGALRAVPEAMLDSVGALAQKLSGGLKLQGHSLRKYANALGQKDRLGMYLAVTADWFDPGAVLSGRFLIPSADLESTAGLAAGNATELFGLCDLALYIPDDILVKVDRASMAWALEARAPLLDHRMVEFALGLPFDLKVRHGVGKWLMRQLLLKYVPVEIVNRPKQGFSVPVAAWLRGPLRNWGEELLGEERISRQGLFSPKVVRRRWAEHQAGRHDWGRLLWNLLMLQAWLQRWMKI